MASAARVPVKPRQRERRSARREFGPFHQVVTFGAIGALFVYFARHPKVLGQIAAVAAIGLTGTFAVWYFQQGNPPKNQMAPAAPIHETRSAPSRTRDDSSVVAAPKPRSDIDGLALAKTPRPGASTLALRDPAIDEWLTAAYLHCWTQPGAPSGGDYAAQIRVTHNADGSLAAAPVLVNPPNDPAWRAFADSTVEAVTKCSPLRVPQKYIARYSQWKKVTLHFSPDNARE